ncbi:MAG: hypothetical protein ABIA21_03805 [Candidatus Aenigmatarchaeota archaeon]
MGCARFWEFHPKATVDEYVDSSARWSSDKRTPKYEKEKLASVIKSTDQYRELSSLGLSEEQAMVETLKYLDRVGTMDNLYETEAQKQVVQQTSSMMYVANQDRTESVSKVIERTVDVSPHVDQPSYLVTNEMLDEVVEQQEEVVSIYADGVDDGLGYEIDESDIAEFDGSDDDKKRIINLLRLRRRSRKDSDKKVLHSRYSPRSGSGTQMLTDTDRRVMRFLRMDDKRLSGGMVVSNRYDKRMMNVA